MIATISSTTWQMTGVGIGVVFIILLVLVLILQIFTLVARMTKAKVNEVKNDFSTKQQAKAFEQAQAARDIAKKTYDRMQNLYDEGVMSAQKRDEAFAAYKASEAQVMAAKSQYDMARNGARQEEKKAAAEQVKAAQGMERDMKNDQHLRETVSDIIKNVKA